MVVIRLARGGSKKRPFYRVVIADKRCPRDGRYIEQIGYFNPLARGNEKRAQIDQTRYEHWVSVGAQPSNRVQVVLKELTQVPESAKAESSTAESSAEQSVDTAQETNQSEDTTKE